MCSNSPNKTIFDNLPLTLNDEFWLSNMWYKMFGLVSMVLTLLNDYFASEIKAVSLSLTVFASSTSCLSRNSPWQVFWGGFSRVVAQFRKEL